MILYMEYTNIRYHLLLVFYNHVKQLWSRMDRNGGNIPSVSHDRYNPVRSRSSEYSLPCQLVLRVALPCLLLRRDDSWRAITISVAECSKARGAALANSGNFKATSICYIGRVSHALRYRASWNLNNLIHDVYEQKIIIRVHCTRIILPTK